MLKLWKRFLSIAALLPALLFAGQCLAESTVATIPGSQPIAVDLNPLTRLAYVANTSTVQVISEETNAVVDTIAIPAGANGPAELDGVGVNPATARLYVSDTQNGLVYVIALAQHNRVIATIPVGIPNAIGVNPRTNKIYVSSFFSNTVNIIDGNTNKVSKTVSEPFPERAVVDIFANRVYVPSGNFLGQVFVLDGNTDAVLAQIPTGNFTAAVAVDFLRHLAYASNQGVSADTSNVSVIDTLTNTVVATIPTDPSPTPISVNPFTNRIYTATDFQSQNVVDIIDGNTRQIVNRLPIAPNPSDSAIDVIHHLLYLTSPGDPAAGGNVTTVIDTRP